MHCIAERHTDSNRDDLHQRAQSMLACVAGDHVPRQPERFVRSSPARSAHGRAPRCGPPFARRRGMRDQHAAAPRDRIFARHRVNTVCAVSGSRLPVGSSARINAGRCTSARASAIRCNSPPDSSRGMLGPRSPRPTAAEQFRDTLERSASRATPNSTSGSSTFCATVSAAGYETTGTRSRLGASRQRALIVVHCGQVGAVDRDTVRNRVGRGPRSDSAMSICLSQTRRQSQRIRRPRQSSAVHRAPCARRTA